LNDREIKKFISCGDYRCLLTCLLMGDPWPYILIPPTVNSSDIKVVSMDSQEISNRLDE
jgi:hypothetical protein